MTRKDTTETLSVCIIGAGIGGLVCAIACRQGGLDVQVLEQATEILPVLLRNEPKSPLSRHVSYAATSSRLALVYKFLLMPAEYFKLWGCCRGLLQLQMKSNRCN